MIVVRHILWLMKTFKIFSGTFEQSLPQKRVDKKFVFWPEKILKTFSIIATIGEVVPCTIGIKFLRTDSFGIFGVVL